MGDGSKAAETTEEGFRKIDGEYVFVAGSSDVAHERHEAALVIRDALAHFGRADIGVFSYDLELPAAGSNQLRSMQKDIPRPSAENCVALVCIVGERIGMPLEFTFDPSIIRGVGEWLAPERSRYRLEPSWPEDPAEQSALLEDGAFPLSGGVFEFLDACGAGKPVLPILRAREPIRRDGPNVKLNDGRWLTEQLSAAPSLEDWQARQEAGYKQQSRGVHNFMRALAAHGINQNPTMDDAELAKRLRAFIAGALGKSHAERVNPYRYLEYFDVVGPRMVGRDGVVNDVVPQIEERLADSSRPAVVRLEGPSGCGKSSTLRGGVLRRFAEDKHRRYRICPLRPSH